EQVVLLTVIAMHVPEVEADRRLAVEPLTGGFYRVTMRYGFMQTPDVPNALAAAGRLGLKLEPTRTSYFLGREKLLPSGLAGMRMWRKRLFAFISRNSVPATAYFGLPPGRVVGLGMQIRL